MAFTPLAFSVLKGIKLKIAGDPADKELDEIIRETSHKLSGIK